MLDRLQRYLTGLRLPSAAGSAESAQDAKDSLAAGYLQKLQHLAESLSDIRAIGLLVFLGVMLLITWSGVKVIQTNYTLQKQISQLQQQNDVSELANNNLKLQNQYLNSSQNLELSARQNFGLGAAGETMLVVPPDVALRHTTQATEARKDTPTTKQPAYQRNFQAWMNFFLDRPSSGS